MKINEYIRYLRLKKGLTQKELGAMMNPPVTKGSVCNWERGIITNISKKHIRELARIFDVSIDDILCINKEDPNKLEEEIEIKYGHTVLEILQECSKLNFIGKEHALGFVQDLNLIDKYTRKIEAGRLLKTRTYGE